MSEKHLCKWKKNKYEDDLEKLKGIVANAKFVCRKCGRAANEKKYLCSPEKIDD